MRDPNPAQVTYARSMVFEHAIETVNAQGRTFSFPLDHAYWMSGLEAADPAKGVARFDGRSLAIPDVPHTTIPEAGGPAAADQTGPYAMAGQAWQDDRAHVPATRNAFAATLTGARAVTLDLRRMRLDAVRPLGGRLSTDQPLELTLRGRIGDDVAVTVDDADAPVTRTAGTLTVTVPAGEHVVAVTPR